MQPNENNLQVYFYKYAPGYTQNPPTQGSLTPMRPPGLPFSPSAAALMIPLNTGAFFHGPLSVTSGDVDNDGKDDVIVAYLDNASTSKSLAIWTT